MATTAAASAAARSFFRSSSVLNAVSRVAHEAKAARAPFRIASRSPLGSRIFRCPVELSACGQSMQPYHTATALALMNSMLTVSPRSFGWLSEGSAAFSIPKILKLCLPVLLSSPDQYLATPIGYTFKNLPALMMHDQSSVI